MFRLKFLMAGLLAAVAAVLNPALASAGFTLTLQETGGPGPTTVNDRITSGGIPADGNYYDGDKNLRNITFALRDDEDAILSNVPYGDFSITMTAKATEGTIQSQVLDSTTTLINNSNVAKTITITITNDDFVNPQPTSGKFLLYNTLTINSLSGASTTNVSSAAGASPPPTGNLAAFTNIGNGFTGTKVTISEWDRNGSPYTLTNEVTITLAAHASLAFQSNTTVAAPGPGGLVLAAGALPFFGLLRRMRRTTTLVA